MQPMLIRHEHCFQQADSSDSSLRFSLDEIMFTNYILLSPIN